MPHQTILLAEDEVAVNQMICKALESEGYGVLSASNGEEAFTVFEANSAKIDLVISDIEMPKVSGIDLRKILRIRNPKLKIILMSGGLSAAQGMTLELDAYDRFLPKPFTLYSFLSLIETFLAL